MAKLPETDPDSLAFTLMMIRLDGCVKCHEGSFKYMRGCQLCATQTVMQFKGTDADLLALYQKARRDIDAYLAGEPVDDRDDDGTGSCDRGVGRHRCLIPSKHIAIIGAGVAGLAAAYDLNVRPQVTIYEAAPQVGGLAAGFKAPHWDWTLEKFYHHWFASDKHMLGLIEELGWSDQVLFPRPYTVDLLKGKFYPLDSIRQQAAKFMLRHFSLLDVFRFGLVGVYLALLPKVEAAGTRHRGRVDAQVGGPNGSTTLLAAHAGGQVRRREPERRQHGVVLGAAARPHDAAGDVHRRVPGVPGQAGRSAARARGGDPAGHGGDRHPAAAGYPDWIQSRPLSVRGGDCSSKPPPAPRPTTRSSPPARRR